MTIFPMVTDSNLRSCISIALQNIRYIVPSLRTFFEDTKWLEPCAKIMRTLLDTKKKESLKRSFSRIYEGINSETGQFRILTQNLGFVTHRGSGDEAFSSGYRQLWLFAWRTFPELSAILPRKDIGKPKPRDKAINQQYQRQLARLAKDLGFSSPRVETLSAQDSDERMIRDFLCQARPPDLYDLDDTNSAILMIRRALDLLKEYNRGTRAVGLPTPGQEPARDRRCGRPHEGSHEEAKDAFFFSQIYDSECRTVSEFSINRDIFHAFFGSQAQSGSPVSGASQTNVVQIGMAPSNAGSTNTSVPTQEAIRPPRHAKTPATTKEPELQPQSSTVNDLDVPIASTSASADAFSPVPPELQLVVEQQPILRIVNQEESISQTELSFTERWEQCTYGDIMLVQPGAQFYEIWGRSNSELRTMDKRFAKLANTHYFAIYDPKSERIAAVKVTDISNYRKGRIYDGVIYGFRFRSRLLKEVYGISTMDANTGDIVINMEKIRGKTTAERLTCAENWDKKRKRRDDKAARQHAVAEGEAAGQRRRIGQPSNLLMIEAPVGVEGQLDQIS